MHAQELAHYPPFPQNRVSPLSNFTPILEEKHQDIHKHGAETSCVKLMSNYWELAHYPPMG